jgi:hypothetical protein
MGSSSSRRKNPRTPIPPYTPGIGGSPGLSRPGMGGIGGATPINRDQQRDLMQANQTIANLNNQIQALQRGGAGMPPMPYGAPPMFGQPPSYTPPSPTLQHPGGFSPYGYQQQPLMGGGGGVNVYRDTDFAAIANIAGLNPADVALLHREFLNLTRGGTNKMDRTVFRHLLREILLEVNNEHVDRTIENMFVTIDRNRDGFIDFPEFVGAFKDVLKGHISDPQQGGYFGESPYPDILTDQLRASGVGSGIANQQFGYLQQAQPAGQFVPAGGLSFVPLASTGIQQGPIIYGAASPLQLSNATPPLITLDPNQSTYVIATPGQYLITEPTALQCVPLPVM